MSAQDWYARRLNNAPAAPPTWQRQSPVYQQSVPAYQQAPVQEARAPAPPIPDNEPLNLHNFVDRMKEWRGGIAHRTDKHPCPECGSPHFFSRTSGNSRMAPPAPHCFSCGYNGQFSQGDPSTWGAA